MVWQQWDLNEFDVNLIDSGQKYIPGSGEKKRAILMYVLFGIIFMLLNNKNKTEFEKFHLNQAIWWWIVFVLFLFVFVVLLFIPWLKYIVFVFMLFLFWILWYFMNQAWNGNYLYNKKNIISMFFWLWTWILNLFDVDRKN